MIRRLPAFTVRAVLTALAAASVLSACTSSHSAPPAPATITQTVTGTRTSAGTAKGLAFTTVAPLPPGQSPPKGEVEKACPWIASTPADNPNVNVADIEGDHVYRTTVLTGMSPVGCRFYFYAGPFEAIADITTYKYKTAVDANNAMVLTSKKGTDPEGQPNLIKGVNGIVFRTKFFGDDGARDWACAFTKGTLMVVVRTQQNDVDFNALQLAIAVASSKI